MHFASAPFKVNGIPRQPVANGNGRSEECQASTLDDPSPSLRQVVTNTSTAPLPHNDARLLKPREYCKEHTTHTQTDRETKLLHNVWSIAFGICGFGSQATTNGSQPSMARVIMGYMK